MKPPAGQWQRKAEGLDSLLKVPEGSVSYTEASSARWISDLARSTL